MNLDGKRALVTGGTGFIGGRLVEKLVLEHGVTVRVLVRNYAHAARIARLPVEMVAGDLTDEDALHRAVEGCEVVFHCGYGSAGTPEQRRAVTVGGTQALAKAALAAKVSRMVHVSTISVYGAALDGDLDETTPQRHTGEVYADTKLDAEHLVLDYHRRHGLPVAVVQPTIVYGPFAGSWTIGPVSQLRNGQIVLVNGGSGLCNAVYVDDVVDAILLAATRDEAVGEAFLVSAEEPVTWRQFYGAYEKMLDTESTVSMSVDDIRARAVEKSRPAGVAKRILLALREKPHLRRRIVRLPGVSVLYRLTRFAVPDSKWEKLKKMLLVSRTGLVVPKPVDAKPVRLPTDSQIAFFEAKARVRIDKAKRLLGYEPRFDIERGMELTARWVKWANL